MSTAVKEREGTGQLNLSLHPLVLINISDHWTRTKVQNQKENPRVIGALLGTYFYLCFVKLITFIVGVQTGRNVEIFNSFELVFSVTDGAIVIDQTYLHKKQEQCTTSQSYFELIFKI